MWIVCGLEKLTGMTAFSTLLRTTVAASATTLLLAAGVAHSTGTRQFDSPTPSKTAAEEAFPDAPMGVDPMVTGPTTTAFRQQQDAAGCDAAAWPNVPMACFPRR
jgi:hypothetical protein